MKIYVIFITLLLAGTTAYAQDIERIMYSDPFNFSSSISARVSFNHINGVEDRTNPRFYNLNARLKFSIYGLDIPMYFSYRNSTYQYGSSLPRIKISPRYKWIHLQIGDVYTRLNPYVLDNRNLRGVALKLTPGKWRSQAIYGKMQDLNTYRDTLLIGTRDDLTFSRPVIGIGLGYGSMRNHLDIYVLKSWDDQVEEFYSERGTTQKSNTVLGTTLKFKLLRNLRVTTHLGLSVLTQNLNAAGSSEAVFGNSIASDLADVNISTNANYAGDIGIQYRYKNIGINTQVRYIQAHYQPLTVAYMNTDLIDYTIGSSLNFWKNKVYLNGRVGVQKNNLSQTDELTNRRVIYSLLGKWKITPSITLNAITNNFSTNLEAKSIQINELFTYSVNNNMKSLSLQYRQPGKGDTFIFRIKGGLNQFTTIGNNESNASYNSTFSNINLGYNWEDLDLTVNVGGSYNQYDRSGITTKTYSSQGNVSKQFFDKDLLLSLHYRYTLIDLLEYREGTTSLAQFTGRYQLHESNSLGLHIAYLQRESYINPTFSEWRSAVSLRQVIK